MILFFCIIHKWDCVKSAIELLSCFSVFVICSFGLKGAGD